ncbi:hypothetical protein QTP88_009188 [Uroleucon formosanum]
MVTTDRPERIVRHTSDRPTRGVKRTSDRPTNRPTDHHHDGGSRLSPCHDLPVSGQDSSTTVAGTITFLVDFGAGRKYYDVLKMSPMLSSKNCYHHLINNYCL